MPVICELSSPGFMEAGLVGEGQAELPEAMVVEGFVVGGWDVAAGAVEASVIEPVDVLECGQL